MLCSIWHPLVCYMFLMPLSITCLRLTFYIIAMLNLPPRAGPSTLSIWEMLGCLRSHIDPRPSPHLPRLVGLLCLLLAPSSNSVMDCPRPTCPVHPSSCPNHRQHYLDGYSPFHPAIARILLPPFCWSLSHKVLFEDCHNQDCRNDIQILWMKHTSAEKRASLENNVSSNATVSLTLLCVLSVSP